jgi:DNA-binding PadR family transcriptional regulator
MPKTFGIHLEIEEIALGTVLRKLNEMPGIAKIDLNLGHGGQGAGKEKLVQGAAQMRGENAEQIVLKFLMPGQKHIWKIHEGVGGSNQRAYGATHQLKKKGLVEAGDGKGMHRLTRKVAMQLNIGAATAKLPALPAPSDIKRGPSGRAAPGSGPIILRNALGAGPMTPTDLRAKLTEGGMSPKGISGVLDRARKHGLIKKNGTGYELTAKGQKIEMGGAANG